MKALRRFILVALFPVCCFNATWLFAAEPVEIIVHGVEGDALANVQEALALPSGFVREGRVDRFWLERYARQAEKTVLQALEPFGYYNAQAKVTLEQIDGDRFRLLAEVTPGPPVRLSEVTVTVHGPGARERELRDLVSNFPLVRGRTLLQQRYERAKGELKSRALELGYLDADFTVHEIRIDKAASMARITLLMQTGPRYFFDAARIEGAERYPKRFLRRYLAFRPGEPFSYAKLGESQLNFTNSERFREVVVTPVREETQDLRVPVLVRLKSVPPRSLRPGIGYGTDTGARFTIRYRDLNAFDRGHEFYSHLYLSERLQGLASGYTIPSSRDIRSSTTIQLNLQQDDVTTYTSRLAALEFDRNRSFGKRGVGTAYVRLQHESFTIGEQDSSSRLVLPGVRFTYDGYNDLVRPTHGYRYGLDLRGTDHILGSSARLIQLIAEGSYLLPLPWRLSLQMRGKAGMTFLSDPVADFPPSLRFFAGGDQSVRGYSYQSLGPTDATGQVVGGKQLLTGSVELERALFKDWGASVFVDAGNAFNSFTNIYLYRAAGIGVHYYTRVGALNLSVARQFGVEDPSFRIHFSVGFEL